jgi:hypothetical protein
VIVETAPSDRSIVLIGVVRGLGRESDEVPTVLEEREPAAVALTLSEEETDALRTHFLNARVEPIVPLSRSESAHATGLARIEAVQVPTPAFLAALEWGALRNRPVRGVDPTEEAYAEMFAEHIGYFELVRRTLRERALVKRPPVTASAEAYAVAWERAMTPGRGSARLARARDAVAAEKVRSLRRRYGSVAALVDRERFDSFRAALESPGPEATSSAR